MAATDIHGRQIRTGTVPLAALVEAVIQADGGQAFTADQPMGGFKLTGLGTPTAGTDATTKTYVDNAVAGLSWKDNVRVATTANITLSGAQTIDGVSVVAGDRVLVKNQTAGQDNGLYLAAAGAWTRVTDADTAGELEGAAVFVSEGTANGNSVWTMTTDAPITVGTTSLVWVQFGAGTSLSAGAGLTLTSNVLDVVAGDTSVTVAADSIAVNLNTTGGLETSTGVRVKLDGATLIRGANGLKLDVSIFVKRETPSGLVNGANTTYTLANTPVAGSEEVFLNGLLQEPGAGNDYTISGSTITYLAAPVSGDKIRVNYTKSV